MKAICVTPDRTLEPREVPAPGVPPAGSLTVAIEACAINHGDKTFLRMRTPVTMPATLHDIWGASGAGRVTAIGPGVPQHYMGRKVAIYRSISMIHSGQTIGLWSEQAQVHHLSCLILPDHVDTRDYSGSLVNIVTAYAFLRQMVEEGHRGIVATAGNSATGRALAALAQRDGVPVLAIVRSAAARKDLAQAGAEYVLDASDPGFDSAFAPLAEKLKATAVFDGVGGALLTRIAPLLAMNSTVYSYGFMAGPEPVSFPTVLLITKNLSLTGFSNFASRTVQDPARLSAALIDLSTVADHPAFRTRIGDSFPLEQIEAAMKAEGEAKSILLP